MTDPLVDFSVGVLSATLRLSPLLLFASLGEIISEKSGVVNLGIEGIMLMGAFATFSIELLTGNAWAGFLAALFVAWAIGLFFSYITVRMHMDQIVAGLSVYLFGLGFSYVLYGIISNTRSASLQPLPGIFIPLLSTLPFVGKVFFQQNILVYISLALVPLVAYFLERTSFGLQIRAVGENPKAADNMGINVLKTRMLAVVIGALLAGAAGAYFEFGYVQTFQFNLIQGRGFIALAIIYFANWSPYRTLFAALLYEIVDSAQSEFISLYSPVYPFLQTSSQLFNMLPYICILALIPVLGRKARAPKYLTVPYRK